MPTINKILTAENAYEMYRKIRRCNDIPDLASFNDLSEDQRSVWRSLLATLRAWTSSELHQLIPYTEEVNGDHTLLSGADLYYNYAKIVRSEGSPMRPWAELEPKIKDRWKRTAHNVRASVNFQHASHFGSYHATEPAQVFGDPEEN